MSVYKPDEPRYGAWMSTSLYRNWEEAVVVVRNDWSEASYVRRKKEEGLRRKKDGHPEKMEEVRKNVEEDLFCIKLHKNTGGDMQGMIYDAEKTNANVVKDDVKADSGRSKVARRRKTITVADLDPAQPKVDDIGPSGCKNTRGQEIGLEENKAGPRSGQEPGISDDVPWVEDLNPMAIIPYTGKILNEVVSKLKVLGLKREAMEEIGPEEIKRRKGMEAEPCLQPEISIYANNLRKVKAKIRRNMRKKEKIEPETLICDKEEYDEVMKDALTEGNNDGIFVFKAGKGRRRKSFITEGNGGWPHIATKAP